jgi:hypothetical protein
MIAVFCRLRLVIEFLRYSLTKDEQYPHGHIRKLMIAVFVHPCLGTVCLHLALSETVDCAESNIHYPRPMTVVFAHYYRVHVYRRLSETGGENVK